MEREVYERMAQVEDHHWWFMARRRIIDEVIRQRIRLPRDAKILEAGCGTGGNLRLLARHGEVFALEPDAQARRMAADKASVHIAEGALPDRLPFDDQAFDLIVMLDVLEHVRQDVESLRALMQRLRPDGRILLTVPAMPFLWSRHDELHHHQRRYTRSSLLEAIRQSGGEAEFISHFNTLLFPLVAGLRLTRKALGINGGDDDAMPPAWLNSTLHGIFASERHFIGKGRLPVGVSLLAIVRRAAQAGNCTTAHRRAA